LNYLELDDFLMIAQAVTGIDAEKLARLPRMTLAESALASPRAGSAGRTHTQASPRRRRCSAGTSLVITRSQTATNGPRS